LACREATSTNAVALALAAQGAPEGSVVVADYQAAGRGREFAAKLGQAQRGEQHNQPSDDQYTGGRGRPWQRYRDRHRQPIGEPRQAHAIEKM